MESRKAAREALAFLLEQAEAAQDKEIFLEHIKEHFVPSTQIKTDIEPMTMEQSIVFDRTCLPHSRTPLKYISIERMTQEHETLRTYCNTLLSYIKSERIQALLNSEENYDL